MSQNQNQEPDLKEKLSRSVCLFLAEMIRTRNVSLKRAADIAGKMVKQIDQVDNEEEFFDLIDELDFDFQELNRLRRDILFYHRLGEREDYEGLVRDYAVHLIATDPQGAVAIMDQALKPGEDLESLKQKFPDFARYLSQQSGENKEEF